MSTLTPEQIAELQRRHAQVVPDAEDVLDEGRHFIPAKHRRALLNGTPAGADIREFRTMLNLTQETFSVALGISVATLRNWEQDHRHPDGPALALLRLVARHPRLLTHELLDATSGK